MRNCLVTGGAGFLGSHLTEALVGEGQRVRIFDNFSLGSAANVVRVRDRIEVVVGDIRSPADVRRAMEGMDLVFHLAEIPSVLRSMQEPALTHEVCATGTLQVLMAALDSQIQRVVYASSASVYGAGNGLPRRESDALQPISAYGAAKLAGENYCLAFNRTFGLDTVRLRLFNIFGVRQSDDERHGSAIPLFVRAILTGNRPVVYGDGYQTRDFLTVADAVQAFLLAAGTPRAAGKAFNIGTGESTSLMELVETTNYLLRKDQRPILTRPRPGDIRHSVGDITRAQVELGYCPSTKLEKGLSRYIDEILHQRRAPRFLRSRDELIYQDPAIN